MGRAKSSSGAMRYASYLLCGTSLVWSAEFVIFRMSKSIKRALCKSGVGVILVVSLWCLQLPWPIDVGVWLLALVIAAAASLTNLSLLTLGVSGGVIVSYVFLSYTSTSYRQFYREHEMFATTAEVYRARVRETIAQPHGDLVAIDPTLPTELWEPRNVEFVTDSLGYRNRQDYAGEPNILLGDSFLVGNGVTQAETLPEVLRTKFQIPVYSMGYPQDPVDYERRAAWAIKEFKVPVNFSFFFFEGNDFYSPSDRGRPMESFEKRYDDLRLRLIRGILGESMAPTTMYKFIHQAERRLGRRTSRWTTIGQSATLAMAHLNAHTDAATVSNPEIKLAVLPQVWERTSCAFFIPTKARVYPESVPDVAEKISEPAPAFVRLRDTLEPLGVRVIDLTVPMLIEKRRAREQGQLLFWRDDTHWNGHGISAVGATVADCLITTRRPSSLVEQQKIEAIPGQ